MDLRAPGDHSNVIPLPAPPRSDPTTTCPRRPHQRIPLNRITPDRTLWSDFDQYRSAPAKIRTVRGCRWGSATGSAVTRCPAFRLVQTLGFGAPVGGRVV